MKDIIQIYNKKALKKQKKSLIIFLNTEFKKKIDSKKSKLKKNQDHYQDIIKGLIFNNGIDIRPNINELKRRLFRPCIDDDYELVLLLLYDQVEINGFKYLLNKEDKEAYLYTIGSAEIVFLPRSIKYKSQEYVITKVFRWPHNFHFGNLDAFICSSDSELKKLEDDSVLSECKKITIPSCLTIQNGLEHFRGKITILPNKQKNIKFYDNDHNIIIGKTDPKSDAFDVLVYADHSTKNVTIPSFIKKIGKSAFSAAENIETITFSKDSQINTIDEYAFTYCTLNEIVIPPHVRIIRKNAFKDSKIEVVKFTYDSKLEIIENDAFCSSSTSSLTLPSSVTKLEDDWCNGTPNLYEVKIIKNQIQNIFMYNDKVIIGKSDLKSDIFDVIVFACRDIDYIKIPSFIKGINPNAFSACHYLGQVDFSENTQLEFIGKGAFDYSSITKISIPANVHSIGKSCFKDCNYLQEINFPNNSELISIESNIISCSIQYFTIPNNVTKIKKGWLRNSKLLKNVFLMPNNKNFVSYSNKFILGKSRIENDTFDVLLFANRNVTEVTIPPFIKTIKSHCFYNCQYLHSVHFSDDSQINSIDEYAFSKSGIQSIIIPDSVVKIDNYAFYKCFNLKKVNITMNSKLSFIGNSAFAGSLIGSFYIPPKVMIIEDFALCNCQNLKAFEIDENSNMVTIYHSVLGDSSPTIFLTEKLEKKLNLKFIDNDNDYLENFLSEVFLYL